MKRLLLGTLVIVALCLAYSTIRRGTGATKDEYFNGFFYGAEQVSELSSFANGNDAYEVKMRFSAPADWVQRLPYAGYVNVPCSDISAHFGFSLMTSAAFPPWLPQGLDSVECFRRRGPNRFSENGRDEVWAEAGGGWVYSYHRGREIDRSTPRELK